MTRAFTFFFAIIILFVAVMACNNKPSTQQEISDTQDSLQAAKAMEDSLASCEQAQQYPNQDKPMALMMRQMADNAQAMKNKIEKGEQLKASEFPFIRFHLVEPTDPDVLQPQFYENARLFQQAHKTLMDAEQSKQKELYNAYISNCIGCHEQYCSGPLKRIRKLVIK